MTKNEDTRTRVRAHTHTQNTQYSTKYQFSEGNKSHQMTV